ncbi:uncharacterized protein LOC127837954 isoform X2 [Dreissena polymorpha]|uniref:uncharacterized protein LOC127837954 isoform X2 n=1 Tax=Dreissena polymorpha TaxID=45954 RepID=UPI002263ADC8|nr:uncharacterized protein LOC127837954 isoform X2 [Dreissena polymorpha]
MENGSSERYSYPKEPGTFHGLLCDIMQGKKSQRIETYCHLPVFGNTDSVTIVSHPGGDNILPKEFMESVDDASILIYVVNSACTDGIQENKLMQMCKQLQSDARVGNLNSFDPKCMMFVCNNWDIVEKKERSDPGAENRIWREIVTKIQKYFPGISEHDQIYKLSTTEASRSRRSGNVMSDRFKKVHEGFRNVILASQKGKLQKHFSWLESLLQHIRKHALVRLQFANDTSKSNDDVKQAFKKLQRFIAESTKMKVDLKQRARSRCTQMVVLLETHLKQPSVHSDIKSRFYAKEDMPLSDDNIDEIRAEVKRFIQGLILEEIQKWEQDSKHYQRTVTMINEEFEKKFQSLREEFEDVERLVHIENEPDNDFTGTDETTVDNSLTAGEKAIMAVTSPIWIPLGIVAALVAIPVVIGSFVNDERKLKDFRKDRSPFMNKWLKDSLKEFLKRKSIDKTVLANYVSILTKRIDQMSARIVSESVQADMVHLESILKDTRESSEIVEDFTDIKTTVQDHIASLRLFELQCLASDKVNCVDITRVKEIGTGHLSEVYAAKYLKEDVALKVIKTSSASMFTHLVELEIFRRLHHEHIVKFKGVCYTDMLPAVVGGGKREKLSNFRLMFLFEQCDTNLEDYVFNNPKLQCGNIPHNSRGQASQFFGRTGQAVCSAMLFIHGRGYAHRKMHLRGVLLQNGTVKLCGPTCKPDTNINDGSRILAPEVMVQGNIGKHTDIFDLGILLWELWYGRRAAIDLKKIRSITCRQHPDCNAKHAMPEGMARVVENCWALNPEDRPGAGLLLQEMYSIM